MGICCDDVSGCCFGTWLTGLDIVVVFADELVCLVAGAGSAGGGESGSAGVGIAGVASGLMCGIPLSGGGGGPWVTGVSGGSASVSDSLSEYLTENG